MIRYQSIMEMSTDKLSREIYKLYDIYKDKYNTLSDVVEYISKKLNISEMEVLQVLEYAEEEQK